MRFSQKDAICKKHNRDCVVRVRDLERLLTAQGVSAAKMDGITRKLRECGRLPTGGRGINAPTIGPSEAAIILVAVAGSPKANEADTRVAKLEPLLSGGRVGARTLLEAVTSLLENPMNLESLTEVRIARTRRRAAFIFRDGKVEEFYTAKPDARTYIFSVEGIMSAPLLQLVARAIRDGARGARNSQGSPGAAVRSPGRGQSE